MNPEAAIITFPSGRSCTVDYFKAFSPVYFLSHFHMDHVVGLRDIQHKCRIYCSGITKTLVLANPDFKAAHPCLAELPVNSPRPVAELPGLTVTLIPAGHCLGSAMFLFEDGDALGEDDRQSYVVLHTGDFRFPTDREALSRVTGFHRNGRTIPIDNAVVDTTFFTAHCRDLPTREESMREICNIVGDCLQRATGGGGDEATATSSRQSCWGSPASRFREATTPRTGVRLTAKARFSYEYVYESLAKCFNTKVHISEQSLRYYGQLAPSLTFYSTRPADCFVHLDGCGCDTGHMLNICLSTMYFDKMAGFNQLVVWPNERTVRVLFSFHPSMSEVADLLAYLKPRAVRALVTPSEDGEGAAGVQHRLEAAAALAAASTASSSVQPQQRAVKRRLNLDFFAAAAAAASAPAASEDSGCSGGGDFIEGGDSDDSLCAMPVCAKLTRIS